MSQDEFTKLFTYMQQEFAEVKSELAKKADKADVNGINNRFDMVIGRLDDIETELVALTSQVNRHDGHIHDLAAHTKLTLREIG